MDNKTKVIVKKPFQSWEVVEVTKGDYDKLKEIIDCTFFDVINLGGGYVMLIDDEGKLIPKEPNIKWRHPGVDDIVCGTVIVKKDGWDDELSDDEIDFLLTTLPYHFHSFTQEEAEGIDPADYTVIEMFFWD